jgi:hypothetical protein
VKVNIITKGRDYEDEFSVIGLLSQFEEQKWRKVNEPILKNRIKIIDYV